MLWIKAFHIIAMVVWFSGLFYLPRLFVYHASTRDPAMQARFVVMEKKLYYYVTHPAMAATLLFGGILLYQNRAADLHASWLHLKLALVFLLFCYHFYLGRCLTQFALGRNRHSAVFYRWFNEVPTLFLLAIVFLAVLRPRIFG